VCVLFDVIFAPSVIYASPVINDVTTPRSVVGNCRRNVMYGESVTYGENQGLTSLPYIRNTPQRVSGTGALRAAENASASTLRVSCGVMMPSSHSRAVA
jgi:hypothetical protein